MTTRVYRGAAIKVNGVEVNFAPGEYNLPEKWEKPLREMGVLDDPAKPKPKSPLVAKTKPAVVTVKKTAATAPKPATVKPTFGGGDPED